MRLLFFVILILLSVSLRSQFSATIQSNLDTIRLCLNDSYVLNQSSTSQNNNTSNYTVNQIPYQPLSYIGTTALNITGTPLVDDQITGVIPIGFTFCFFGNQYNQCYIGSNGWLGFTPGQTIAFTSQLVPNTGPFVPRNCIMGPWHDLNPNIPNSICTNNPTRNYIRYRTEGIAPYRRFVVSWVNIPMYACVGICGTQQIILYESTNVIENHIERKVTCLGWAGGTATQAIHNSNGTIAVVVPGRNATVWNTTNNSWRWTPSGVTPPVVSWFINNTFITNNNSLTIQNLGVGCYNVRLQLEWDCVFSQFFDNIWICVEDCCPVNTGPIYIE